MLMSSTRITVPWRLDMRLIIATYFEDAPVPNKPWWSKQIFATWPSVVKLLALMAFKLNIYNSTWFIIPKSSML